MEGCTQTQMAEYIHPSCYKIYAGQDILARKARVKAYEETENISSSTACWRLRGENK